MNKIIYAMLAIIIIFDNDILRNFWKLREKKIFPDDGNENHNVLMVWFSVLELKWLNKLGIQSLVVKFILLLWMFEDTTALYWGWLTAEEICLTAVHRYCNSGIFGSRWRKSIPLHSDNYIA